MNFVQKRWVCFLVLLAFSFESAFITYDQLTLKHFLLTPYKIAVFILSPGEVDAATLPAPDVYTVNRIAGNFVDISATGNKVAPTPGDEGVITGIPFGFDFEFFGTAFNNISITANGYLTFFSSLVSAGNKPFPSPQAPNGLIAPFWDDLNPEQNPDSAVYYEIQGAAPDRRFIVQWDSIPLNADPASRLTFEAILFEGSGEIQFHYLSMINGNGSTGSGLVSGRSATIGIESPDGSRAKEIAFNRDGTVTGGSAFSFTLSGNGFEQGTGLGDLDGDEEITILDQSILTDMIITNPAVSSADLLLADIAVHPGTDGRAFGDGILDENDHERIFEVIMHRESLNPTLAGSSYIAAQAGDTLTLAGSGFDCVAGNNTVHFIEADGTETTAAAESTNPECTELTVTVPGGLQTISTIRVSQNGLLSNEIAFYIEGSPVIAGITPDNGEDGDTVSIRGHEFGSTPGQNVVIFNGLPATVLTLNSYNGTDELVVTVPESVSTGPVTVTVDTRTSNEVLFSLDGLPVVELSTPDENGEITAITDIIGTVFDHRLVSYTLEYAPAGEAFTVLAGGTDNIMDGTVGVLDPTLQLNGLYNIRLTATDESGNTESVSRDFIISGNAKPGIFTLSFTDLSVPVSGFPITLTRTYDSRVKTKGDFGVGWDLDISRGSFRHNSTPGEGWLIREQGGFIPIPCKAITETENHITEVRLSDSEQYYFRLTISNGFTTGGAGGCLADAGFAFIDGTSNGATLNIIGNREVFQYFGDNVVLDNYILENEGRTVIYSPEKVRLTTLDGRVFDFDISEGVTRIQDRNGNFLAINSNGVSHSDGMSIDFVRDSNGRITKITDPAGEPIDYTYNSEGDLVSVTDRNSNRTEFTYDTDHYLTDIFNPDGTRAVRSEYDENGRLIATIDSEGNRIEQDHDLENRREVIVENGYSKIIEYDERGNVTREVDQEGVETSRSYDADGNILTETNSLGGTTTYVYDADGYLLSQEDPLGHITSFTHDASGKLLSITDPLLNTTSYTYESTGRLETTQNPAGIISTNTYDAKGNMLTRTDFSGNTTTYEYDALGRLTKMIDAEGNETAYTNDTNGNKLSETRTVTTPAGPRDLTTAWTYDNNGKILSVTDPEGNPTNFEYDSLGNETVIENALGNSLITEYNPGGKVATKTYPDGLAESFSYDRLSVLTALTDRTGQTKTLTYNKADKPLEIIYPDETPDDDSDNPRISVQYGPGGRMREMTNLGASFEYDYDLTGRLNSFTDPMGNEISFIHDENGNLISEEDPLGRVREHVYDSLDRRIQSTFPDGNTVHTEYDAVGNVISTTDKAGNATLYEYDKLNRLTAVEDALGGRTLYGYDEAGNLISQTDANGHVTRFEYDGLGRKTAVIRPLGQRAEFKYDAVGNLIEETNFNGEIITYHYNELNKLSSKQFPDGSAITFTYTPSGRQATVQDSRGTTQFIYDTNERLLSRTDPDGTTISYTYDVNNKVLSKTIPSGTTFYTYDPLGRVTSVTDIDGGVTSHTYDEVGNLIHTERPNGSEESRTYDAMNRVTLLENRDSSNALLSSYTYTYDALGNPSSVVEDTGRRVDYVHDELNRLTSETINDPAIGLRTIQYTYDSVGNRLTRNDSAVGLTSYAYDDNDRLLSENIAGDAINYTYDDNGNIVSEDANLNYTIDYSWDAENRLVGAVLSDSTGTKTISYSYNEEGLRVSSSIDGVETNYLLDTTQPFAQVLEEYAADGTTLASYTYGNSIISQNRNGQENYYLPDIHSGVRVLTDDQQDITDAYDYDAFGRLIGQSGNTYNNYLYRGEQSDPAINQYYLRARYYNQENGRLTSVDPYEGDINSPVSLHRYMYANGNPVTYSDPSGMFTLVGMMVTVAIVAQLVTINGINLKAAADYFGLNFKGPIKWDGDLATFSHGVPGFSIDWGIVSVGISAAYFYFHNLKTDCVIRGNKRVKGRDGTWLMAMAGLSLDIDIPGGLGAAIGEFNLEANHNLGIRDSVLEGAAWYAGISLLWGTVSKGYLTAGRAHGKSGQTYADFGNSVGTFIGISSNYTPISLVECPE